MSNYEFIQVTGDKIKEYSQLLSKVFAGTNKYTEEFLRWQYVENPNGTVVGYDAYSNGTLAAHYVTIPVLYLINGVEAKGLLSLNTATHPDHQGKGLFTQLASKTYELGQKLGYKFVIGVANQNSTHGFLKKLGFYLITPLDVKLGFGSVKPDNGGNYMIKPIWNEASLNWRMKSPGSSYFLNGKNVFSKTDKPGIYSWITYAEQGAMSGIRKKSFIPVKLWIGVARNMDKQLMVSLPDKFKPSPLNLIFRNLGSDIKEIKKEDIYFELIDFDAY